MGLALVGTAAHAAPLAPAIRNVIPSAAEQIISLDYRTIKQSETALALKAQVLPKDLKEFEKALRTIGISPDKDMDALTFVSFRNNKQELKTIGIASGAFSSESILTRLPKTVKAVKYREFDIYPMYKEVGLPASRELSMTFLAPGMLLFGNVNAIQMAINARAGGAPTLDSNEKLGEVIKTIKSAAVWSVLNRQGTREMLLSAIGANDPARLADYAGIQNQVMDSHYSMNFDNGVAFDLNVLTADTQNAVLLSSVLQSGALFKIARANPAAKIAFKSINVVFDRSQLQIHFGSGQEELQRLLRAQFFAVVSKTPLSGQTERPQ